MECYETQYDVQTDIDLAATLHCGQTFLWKRMEKHYIGCIDGVAALAYTNDGALHVRSDADAGFWEKYFDMHRDYAAIAGKHLEDIFICKAYAHFGKMHVLNQPVWETLCSFLISANNNIARITGIIDRLRENLGDIRHIGEYTTHTFPSPGAIANAGEAFLRALGLGYGAPYLYDTACRIYEGYDLSALQHIGYARAQKELTAFKGVGEKVADCILLFSCGYTGAFPVDVWVLRVMNKLYGVQGTIPAVKDKGRLMFGDDAGIVQQLLFHGARMNLFEELL